MGIGVLQYVGAGVAIASLVTGVVSGVIGSTKAESRGGRYGAFMVPFLTFFGAGYYAAAIAFSFQFLDREVAEWISIVFALAFIGLVVARFRLNPRGKSMLLVQSIPLVFCWPLLPLAVWNLVYAMWLMPKTAYEELPNKSPLPTPASVTPAASAPAARHGRSLTFCQKAHADADGISYFDNHCCPK